MEGIPTMLTDEEQTLVRSIPFAGMSTDWAGLRGVVGIDLDRHTPLQKGFIGDHGVQFSKGPLGRGGIGLSLLLACTFAPPAFRSLSEISQIFQAKERMRMGTHNLFTHDMISVLLQPSLPSTNHDQTAGSGTGAFLLKTLSQACIMIGLRYKELARMEGLLTL